MLEIARENELKEFHYSITIKPLYEKDDIYHTHIFSDMKGVSTKLVIQGADGEKTISIPGGRGLVEIFHSDISIYTEEPVTVQPNGSGSKEEHPKK